MFITDICDFVYDQNKKIMKYTKHENDWFYIMIHYLYLLINIVVHTWKKRIYKH